MNSLWPRNCPRQMWFGSVSFASWRQFLEFCVHAEIISPWRGLSLRYSYACESVFMCVRAAPRKMNLPRWAGGKSIGALASAYRSRANWFSLLPLAANYWALTLTRGCWWIVFALALWVNIYVRFVCQINKKRSYQADMRDASCFFFLY